MSHGTVGLLLALPLLVTKRGTEGRDALGLTPVLIVLILLSANLPDVLHFGDVRILSHGLIAWFLLSGTLAYAFHRRLGLDRTDTLAILVAGLAHPVGDLLFDSYYPFYPFETRPTAVGSLRWNSPEHLVLESVLTLILLVILLSPRLAGGRLGGDWRGNRDPWMRIAIWTVLFLLAANLFVFASLNLLEGADRGPVALTLFVEGLLVGVPFLRAAGVPRGRTTRTATGGDAYR